MPIPRKGQTRSEAEFVLASEDVARLKDEVGELVETALGVSWYAAYGNQSDAAALALCRLRRASAGLHGGGEQGDAAVRRGLEGVSPDAVAWIASRAISYMDESGYPEAVEPWFPEPAEP